jgi:hypothetical protein
MIKGLTVLALIGIALGFGSGVLKLPTQTTASGNQAPKSTTKTAKKPLLVLTSDADVNKYLQISEVNENNGEFSFKISSKVSDKYIVQVVVQTAYPQYFLLVDGKPVTVTHRNKFQPQPPVGIMPHIVN